MHKLAKLVLHQALIQYTNVTTYLYILNFSCSTGLDAMSTITQAERSASDAVPLDTMVCHYYHI
jgi:hypothetical protein